MTYLELCARANQMAGLQGTITAVASVTGYQQNLVDYVAEAYEDLQNMRTDWRFMRSNVTFNTVQGTTEYSLSTIGITDHGRWLDNIAYADSNGYLIRLRPQNYDRFLLEETGNTVQSKPFKYTEDPVDRHLYINEPDGVYAITAHYMTKAVVLALDADVPLLPSQFHLLIAYLGAMKMANFMGNTNMYSKLQVDADYLLGSMMRSELPPKKMRVVGIA